MSVLYWIAYVSWALAVIAAVIGIDDGGFVYFVIALAVSISGVLFFAFGKVIFLLSDIRDALDPPDDEPEQDDGTTALPERPLYPGQPIVRDKMRGIAERDSGDDAEDAWLKLEGKG